MGCSCSTISLILLEDGTILNFEDGSQCLYEPGLDDLYWLSEIHPWDGPTAQEIRRYLENIPGGILQEFEV